MESKRNETFGRVVFGTNAIQETSRGRKGSNEADTGPGGAPSCLVATSLLPCRPLQVSWIAFVPKRLLPKVSFRLDSI